MWHGVLVYINEIIAYGSTWSGSLECLKNILRRLCRENLQLKGSKFLFRKEVEFLGHIVSREGVRPLIAKVMVLQHWVMPETLDELRSFLGLACYSKHFVPNYREQAAPLNLLTRKAVLYGE